MYITKFIRVINNYVGSLTLFTLSLSDVLFRTIFMKN